MPSLPSQSDAGPGRGRISRLDLVNFKSYGGKTTLGPFLDFSAVVGPNGAGKSNFMDAISFAVGVQSKDLRGRQLKDLIYRSTTDDGTEERSASVTLVYECDGVETKFMRAIRKDGVGEYRIDGKAVKWEAYSARLKALGVLTQAHTGFLVFQGYVAELASKSPAELTKLFEEISGSGELKPEYERLESEKKQAEEDQVFNHQKKKGLMAEKNIMKKQKEEAEKYTGLQERRKALQQRASLLKLFSIEREVASLLQERQAVEADFEAASGRQSAAEDEVKGHEKEKAGLSRKSTELERKVVQLQQQAEGKSPAAIKLREEISHVQKRKLMHAKSLDKVKGTYAATQKEVAQLESEHAALSEAIARLDVESAAAEESGELQLSKQQRDEYNRLKQEAGSRTAALREEMHAKQRELRSEDHLLVQLRTRTAELAAEMSSIEAKLAAFDERKQASADRAAELRAAVQKAQHEQERLRGEGAQARERHAELTHEVMQAREKLRGHKADKHETEKERKASEHLENMQRLFPGVHGRVIELCKPSQKKYNAAVTVAMGKNMDAIVVESEATAQDCIRYLKEKKGAPETFVPLDTIRAMPIAERMRQLGGSKRPVIDVISVNDERFLRAVQYAVGDALVCDTLDEARKLAYHNSGGERYKVVTVDGTIINKAGLMTGGSSGGERARAARWNQQEYEVLKASEASMSQELAAIGSLHRSAEREQAAAHRLESKQQELKTAEADLSITKGKVAKLTADLQASSKAHARAADEMRALQQARAQQEAGVQALVERCNQEEDRVFAAFSKALKLGSVREYEQNNLQREKEKELHTLELKTQLDKISAKLKFEQKKDLKGAIQKLEASIASDKELLDAKAAEQAKAEAAAAKLREQVTKVEQELGELKSAHEAKATEVKQQRKQLKQAAEASAKAKAKLAQLDGELDQQRSRRATAFQRARLEEVDIPLLAPGVEPEAAGGAGAAGAAGGAAGGAAAKKRKRAAAAAVASSGAAGAAADGGSSLLASESFSPTGGLVGTQTLEGEAGGSGAAAAAQGGEAEEQVRIDFASIDARSREPGGRGEQEAQEGIDEVDRALEGMAPNMKALQQYEEVQARLHSMEGVCDTSRAAAVSLRQQFEGVRSSREDLFLRAFNHISKAIDDIYKDLTQVEGVPLGGTAYLALEDPTDPFLHGITYHAMPPSKRFRAMSDLSGGERTLAALALLFAIHEFRPSPFFVMDEIDAALDNVNVTRVADFIRERAEDGHNQFVVISLKDTFYEKAQALVGIYRDRQIECSRSVTLDLDKVAGVAA